MADFAPRANPFDGKGRTCGKGTTIRRGLPARLDGRNGSGDRLVDGHL